MAIFVDQNTKVIVQGLTGSQGRYHGLRNRDYGTKVVGGVSPGKGGTDIDGVPVYNSVAEAVAATRDAWDRHNEPKEQRGRVRPEQGTSVPWQQAAAER